MATERLSLLLVIDHLSSGGAQQQLVLLARELHAQGHVVQFLVYRHHPYHEATLQKAGIQVEVVAKGSKFSLAVANRISEKLRTESIDGVLAFLTGPSIYALLGRWRSGRRVPLIVSERSSPNNPQRGWVQRASERLWRFADRVVVNSHHMRKYFQGRFPKLANRVVTIWNGVDVERFRAIPLPKVGDTFSLVALGQIGTFKQPECVIRGLAILRDRYGVVANLDWYARRYPDLTNDERSQKESLDQLITELKLESQWKWLPETREIDEVLPRYQALVHASIVEGLPNAVCEALSCGRPVIASNTLDHPLLLDDENNGFLFEPSSPESLADALYRFINSSETERQTLADHAAKFARERLSPSVFAEQYVALFRELIERPNQPEEA
ncbi:MAG: glycosyltransferase family 4 protein [Pirellulaceae bacterium]|nr:glycosyltransferase family 4 protein [Pirellulaceae bacterium]